jgi:uncharacterized membrane protein
MKKAIVGIVESRAHAEAVVESLREYGLSVNDISVLFPDKRGTQDFAHTNSTKAPEGAIAGVSTGGLLGGTLGLLAGIGALAIPGLGPFIAAGPLMAALSGAAAGATLGGLTGALVGMGIPEIEAKVYDGKVRGGNILIAVHVESPEARKMVEEILERHGASDVASMGEASVPREQRNETTR